MQSRFSFFKNKFLYKLIPIFAVLVVGMPFLMKQGIPFGNDASFHLSRIASLSEGLREGVFLPGVYADYFSGMGYGNGLFYPDIFLYIPAVMILFGLAEITAYKFFLILLTALTAVSMYYAVKLVWKSDFAACVSAAMMVLCSFHTTDLYLRSSVGELLAFLFLPLIVAGLHQIVYGDIQKWPVLFIGFTGLVLSHVLTAVMMAVLSALFLISAYSSFLKEPKRLYGFLKATIWSLIISCFFIVPMVEQIVLNPVWGDTGLLGNIADWAVPLDKLILAVPQNVGEEYVPPAGIGFVLLLIAAAGLFYGKKDKFLLGLSSLGGFLLFCSSVYFPWKLFGNTLSTLQFPWRFYLFISVFWCFAGGRILELIPLKGLKKTILTGIVLIGMLISFTVNVVYIYKNYTAMLVNPYPLFAAGCEYLPEAIDYGTLKTLEKETDIDAKRIKYNEYILILEQNASKKLPVIYYPGYTATLNGKKLPVQKDKMGMVNIELKEAGVLKLHYSGTLLRHLSMGISLGGILLGVLLMLKNKTMKREKYGK